MHDDDSRPNRWLHLRLDRPFTDDELDEFRAHAAIWRRYVEATLEVWPTLGYAAPAPRYVFFEPELSLDRTTATLPVGGEWSLASRALFEGGASYMLWQHFPRDVRDGAEEGLTEEHGGAAETHWRPAQGAELPQAAADLRGWEQAHEHPRVVDAARRALWWVSGILPPA